MYQQAFKNFLPKFLLVQKSIATRIVTRMHIISSLIIGGRTKRITKIVALMINI
jgi:hypothetical protein